MHDGVLLESVLCLVHGTCVTACAARKGMPRTATVPKLALRARAQVYWWHEKYRPRKAKYFNRVHTGYEWNKYNQTHYDHDNPPPKVVQGYKFNIFFPDLIDKQEAPVYSLDKVCITVWGRQG